MYTSYKADTTLNIIAIVDPIAQLMGVFVVPLFSRRILLMIGGVTIGSFGVMIGVFDNINEDFGILALILGLVIFTSII